MKATIDIPDDLVPQGEVEERLAGKPVREVTAELYRQWLGEPATGERTRSAEEWLRGWLDAADVALSCAPAGPTARRRLEEDRESGDSLLSSHRRRLRHGRNGIE